jgi:putative cell wall-binding protein
MRRSSIALVALLATVAGLVIHVPAADAHPVPHAGPPRIRNLHPLFGEVVSGGAVEVSAQVLADIAITGWTLTIDGVQVPAEHEGEATHGAVVARPAPTLTAGDHVAQLQVTGSDGRSAGRAWRFTVSGLGITRLAGATRIETAVEISRDQFDAGLAPGAVLARADDFADALAGAALAESVGGPVLLTDRSALPSATRAELQRVTIPAGVVYVLGGPGAIDEAVVSEIQSMGRRVQRISGADRFGTAAAVARELPAPSRVFVVNGGAFADALGASSPSAARGMPVLLTARDSVPPATRAFLQDNNISEAVVVGGAAVVADAVTTQLDSLVGAVTRVAGADRYATAAAVAEAFFAKGKPIGLASGERFPDALAGGRRMGALGGPLVLTPPNQLAVPDAIGALNPPRALVFGGTGAVSDQAITELRSAVVDAGGPVVTQTDPAPNSEINSLTTFTFGFDRDLNISASNVYVTVAGEEVGGTFTQGDFVSELVFTTSDLPITPVTGQAYDVRAIALAFDGTRWRHFDHHLVLRKLDLAKGDTGSAVLDLQQRLTALGYWLGTPDGSFGTLTHQAVLALQKVNNLPRDGVVGARTRTALATNTRPTARAGGDHIEVDKARQVLFIVRGGQVAYTLNTSTGTEKPYTFEGDTYVAHTPTGTFTISREIDGMRESRLGKLWRPKYFTSDGVAVHGSSSVPAYPASHGCVRLTVPAMDWVWANNLMPIGMKVIVY